MKTVLFLGAGASVFAGCPTTKKLKELTLDDIHEKLGAPIDGNETNRLKFLEHIVEIEQLDDIEKIYSCANGMLGASNQYSDTVLHNMTYTGNVQIQYPDVLAALRTLKGIIHKIMLSSFAVGDNQDDIVNMYGSLFDVVGGSSGSVDVITTNYDNVIETYCNRTNTRRVDGFVQSINGDHRKWDDVWETENGCVRMVKLHGSVTWQRRDGGIIGMAVPGSRQEGEDVLIAPTLDAKDYGEAPFPQLFGQCNDMLSDTDTLLVVIGYSFRDDVINGKIMDAINRGMQMLVVSPSAEDDVQANLKPDSKLIKGIRSKIEIMPVEFGRDEIAGLCERVKAILGGG